MSTAVIRKNLLQLIFSGAYLWRWNDKLRPVQLSEIEKQAHKMFVACVLWHEYTRHKLPEEKISLAKEIIEGAIFDYFYRVIITDIKPPVFYKIRENNEHYKKLTKYALGCLEPVLEPLGSFWQRMREWHLERRTESGEPASRILSAAHLFASRWEFQLIRPLNPFDEDMEVIAESFRSSLEKYQDLPGMQELLDSSNALGRFANLCGRLRFQIRWAQAPRIPATSVLGHMFIVAVCAWMFSIAIDSGRARACNTFFSGIFHDFPELLTRDIISPVKQSSPDISQVIREYEQSELEQKILAPLRNAGFSELVERISYYLGLEIGSEFKDCCRIDGKIKILKDMHELAQYGADKYDPKDGYLLKCCDLFAAFLEAHNSICNGVSSPHLIEARARLKNELSGKGNEYLRFDGLLADFD